MLKQNPFILPTEQYTRKLDFFGDYVKDSAYYIAKMTEINIPIATIGY